MRAKLWGVLAAVAAVVQSSAANAQSDQVYAWSIGSGWEIKRGDLGCAAFHESDPFFTLAQLHSGTVMIGLRAAGGRFSPGDPVYLQFWGTDSSGQPTLTKTYAGNAGPQSTGSLMRLDTQGDFASETFASSKLIVSPGPNSNPQPVVIPNFAYAMRVMRRCLTELGRVDRGSGLPATTPPVLLNPRSPLVTPDDYPAAARREEAQGVTMVRLTVSAKGLISDCRIQSSSGRVDLDEQTCLSLSRRARYTPATDARGNPTEGQTIQPIRWQMPRD